MPSLLLAIGLMPSLAFADDDSDSDKTFEVETPDAFEKAVDAINKAEGGLFTIELDGDINLNGIDCTFEKNTTTILGEDNTLSGGNNATLEAEGSATLKLGVEGYDGKLTIKGGNGADPAGPLVSLDNGATLYMCGNVELRDNTSFGGVAGVQLENGSAFYMLGGVYANSSSSLNFSGGEIRNCSGVYGDGVCLNNGSTAKFANCTIAGNSAQAGGGVLVAGNSSADFSGGKNVLCNNKAADEASDVYLDGARNLPCFSRLPI